MIFVGMLAVRICLLSVAGAVMGQSIRKFIFYKPFYQFCSFSRFVIYVFDGNYCVCTKLNTLLLVIDTA